MYPCDSYSPKAPALYIYYAVMSILVIILAVTLIWVPFVQLILELNTIISRVLIYINKELLGESSVSWLDTLGVFFGSQQALLIISVSCVIYMFYLASGNFLIFARCFVCNLPNHAWLQKIKKTALDIIEYLLYLKGKRRRVTFYDSVQVNYNNTPAEHNHGRTR